MIPVYGAYNFVDKDPIIDEMRTIMQKENLSSGRVQELGGPSAATIEGWFGGKTRRPQHATAMAFIRACGYDYRLVRTGAPRLKKGEKRRK